MLAKRPSGSGKPITVVGERKQSKSSKACCRCEDRFILIETARAVRSRDYRVNQDNLLVGLTGS